MKQKKLIHGNKNKNVIQLNNEKPFSGSKIGTVVAGSKEYDELKANGLLKRYEIQVDISKEKVISFREVTPKTGNKTMSNTPCDMPPVQGTQPWSVLTDDATSVVNFGFNFCFYGVNYTSCRIGTNGNLQFGTSNTTAFSSVGFPSTTVKMIAPFWSDLHVNVTSGGLKYGKVYYDIYATRMVVSWDSSAYYSQHVDKLNSFQCVITDGTDPLLPPGKNVGFYYKKMQWTTGDASDGINGFPDPTLPAIPATVGANEGNGTDYFLIGRFGVPGSAYDGPLGNNDGVSWLDGKKFFFNVCPPVGANQEPISTLIGYCDTLRVCGNDTLYIKNTFIAPEVTQSTTITATAPTLGGSFTYSNVSTGNSADIYMIVDGNTAPAGYHTVTMSATDDGTPALTSIQTFVVYVDHASVNNLNGIVVTTPTIGACPGNTVSASVTVTGGTPDSYLWSNNQTTASTTFTTVIPADSLIFVTLTSGQCHKTLLGDININPVPTASISGATEYCLSAGPTVLTATNVTNPSTQGPHTYTWTGTGSISSANSSTTTLSAGYYTVTVANQFGCISTQATTITANEGPNFSMTNNSTANDTIYCASLDTARFAFHYAAASTAICDLAQSNCVSSATYAVGTRTLNSNGTTIAPMISFWESTRHQYLFTATELTNAGLVAGKLSSISFSYATIGTVDTYNNFTIKLKCTNATAVTTTPDDAGLSQVFMNNVTITAGINTYNFTQPYIWDGLSNLLIDVCHNNSPFATSSSVACGNAGFVSTLGHYDDGVDLCGSTSTFNGTSTTRPYIVFGHCLAQQLPSQFDVTVTPTVGVVIPAAKDSIKIDLPPGGTTQCYTLTVSNPLGGCARDTVICVYTDLGVTNATFVGNKDTVCIGSPVTLTASGATTYTVNYIQNGSPVFLSNNTSVIHTPVLQGLNVYSLTAIGNCGAAPVGYTVGVFVIPAANLVISPMVDVTKCLNRSFVISTGVNSTNSTPGTPYTYAWTTLPSGFPAPGVNNASTYTCSSNSTTTLVLTVNGSCANTAKDTVVISNFVNNLAVSINNTLTLCPNSPFSMTSTTSGGHPVYNYNWAMNSNTVSTTSVLSYTSPGTAGLHNVTITVTDSCGYQATDTKQISVLPNTLQVSILDSSSTCANSEFSLHAQASNGYHQYTYVWSLGSTILSSGQTLVTNSPPAEGLYSIVVTAKDSCGYQASDIQVITVSPPCNVEIPNVITPNGDGVNDIFVIKNLEYHPNSTLTIFDRWGRKVYTTGNYNNDWKGEGISDGTFYYVLDVPQDKSYNGFITVFHNSK